MARGDRLVVHPLADRQVEYPHAEGGENNRTAAIHRSASGHDLGKSARHEASIPRLPIGEMGRGVGLHDVLDVGNHVLRSREYFRCEIAKRNMMNEWFFPRKGGVSACGGRS